MGMGIGINDTITDEGVIKGHQEEVACDAWFTASGRIIIRLIKQKKKDESIVEIDNIRVLSSSKKNFCGIQTIEFICEAVVEGFMKRFKLFFYTEEQIWRMIML
ncbi:hypothetical protein [Konateibacter massiliensis]|uniref:hypothetical protein n=1 Tax=Konateibacter massiliensis TaxID=2002841 RepID=UPI000C159826|nr:hypothetical protein [Konateibacter massiliensis]